MRNVVIKRIWKIRRKNLALFSKYAKRHKIEPANFHQNQKKYKYIIFWVIFIERIEGGKKTSKAILSL
jgi:hypothetical protein